MKYLANTTNKSIFYQGKEIGPGQSILLSNTGGVIDEITDNAAELASLQSNLEENYALKTELTDLQTTIESNAVQFDLTDGVLNITK